MILCDRVKLAFNEGSIIEETINLCAAISAKSHGDARKAIELLRASAIYAEENGFSQVLPEHINKVFDTVDADRFEKYRYRFEVTVFGHTVETTFPRYLSFFF